MGTVVKYLEKTKEELEEKFKLAMQNNAKEVSFLYYMWCTDEIVIFSGTESSGDKLADEGAVNQTVGGGEKEGRSGGYLGSQRKAGES